MLGSQRKGCRAQGPGGNLEVQGETRVCSLHRSYPRAAEPGPHEMSGGCYPVGMWVQSPGDFCHCYVATTQALSELRVFVKDSVSFLNSLPLFDGTGGRTRCETAKDEERGSGGAWL